MLKPINSLAHFCAYTDCNKSANYYLVFMSHKIYTIFKFIPHSLFSSSNTYSKIKKYIPVQKLQKMTFALDSI